MTEKSEIIKIMLLGDSSVGKTSFIQRYTEDTFQDSYLSTYGIDHKIKFFEHSNKKTYKLFFYDTAGQEKYKSIALNIIKNADGIILLYDITQNETFEAISSWMEDIESLKGKGFPIVLIGNKIDLEEMRVVETKEGQNLAKQYKINFFETSNKDGTNIEKACLSLINIIVNEREISILNDFEIIKKDEKIILENKKVVKPKKRKCFKK